MVDEVAVMSVEQERYEGVRLQLERIHERIGLWPISISTGVCCCAYMCGYLALFCVIFETEKAKSARRRDAAAIVASLRFFALFLHVFLLLLCCLMF